MNENTLLQNEFDARGREFTVGEARNLGQFFEEKTPFDGTAAFVRKQTETAVAQFPQDDAKGANRRSKFVISLQPQEWNLWDRFRIARVEVDYPACTCGCGRPSSGVAETGRVSGHIDQPSMFERNRNRLRLETMLLDLQAINAEINPGTEIQIVPVTVPVEDI